MFNSRLLGLLHILSGLLAATHVANAQSSKLSTNANNQPNTETLSTRDLTKDNKPAPGEDEVDQTITNRKMRAETGSLSKWSVTTALGYSMGSVEKPLSAFRPNIRSTNSLDTLLQSIQGNVGIKYRATKMDSLKLSAGLRMMNPFLAPNTAQNADDRQKYATDSGKFDVFNPSIEYTRVFALGKTQNYVTLGQTLLTSASRRQVGYISETSLQHVIAYDFGGSKFTMGLLNALAYDAFDKTGPALTPFQVDIQAGFYPFIEYVLNDRLNLRTLVGYTYEHRRNNPTWTYFKNKVYQSVGIGISLTRDVFLYPNIQFIPSDLRGDQTNVALSTNINIF